MNHLTAGLLLVLLPLSAQAFTLDEWRAWQESTPPFETRFEQSRWLADSETRVHANGRLVFTPRDSLVWQWQIPEVRSVEHGLTGTLAELPSSDGAPPLLAPIGAEDDGLPGERQIAQLMLHTLHGEHRALNREYYLLLSGEREDWQLLLIPRGEADDAGSGTAEPGEIRIEGGRFIERFQAFAPDDDQLQLQFSDHRRLVDVQGALTLLKQLLGSATSGSNDEDED